MTYKYKYKNELDKLVHDGFTQKEWGKRDIINKTKISTKQGPDTIHDVILSKYQKYPSNTILKFANVLAEAIKLPYGRSLSMTPHDTYSIPIHVHTITLSEINHKQKR